MKLRLGLGDMIVGINRTDSDPNPTITFRQSVVRGTVDMDVTGKVLSPPDFSLEIVGLEGLVVLEHMVKKARESLQAEEDYLAMMVAMEYLLEL